MPLHDFILPKPHTNSTVFDFLVIFCSFYVYSLVPGGWHQCLPMFDVGIWHFFYLPPNSSLFITLHFEITTVKVVQIIETIPVINIVLTPFHSQFINLHMYLLYKYQVNFFQTKLILY